MMTASTILYLQEPLTFHRTDGFYKEAELMQLQQRQIAVVEDSTKSEPTR